MPSREQFLHQMEHEEFDLLVIGGGATGSGVVLDSVTRGLKSAIIEAHDFASGTSSRSTKLLHGGIRYLELAVKHLDKAQYQLVKQGLQERYTLLKLAPHLTRIIPIAIPYYSYWEGFYYWAGVKLYERLSGSRRIGKSRRLTASFLKEQFPSIHHAGLKGGVLYYEGQFDDSRMNLSLILTAISYGAAALNYTELIGFKTVNGKIAAAQVRDRLTGNEWSIRAKVIVNAAGPWGDTVRRMDDPHGLPLLEASRGSHFIVDRSFGSREMGLLIPKTRDKRMLFLLPWHDKMLVGTTDIPTDVVWDPQIAQEEMDYLQLQLKTYLGIELESEDIKASWAGLRPLLRPHEHTKSSEVVRDFHIEVSPSGLVSILGGKWTSYRLMAEKTIDEVLKIGGFKTAGPCRTEHTFLMGAVNYNSTFIDKIKSQSTLDEDIVTHLLGTYGDQTVQILALAHDGLENRLVHGFPYIGAEVAHACRHEYAFKVADVVYRRVPIALLDKHATLQALPLIVEIMGKELKWNREQKKDALFQASQS